MRKVLLFILMTMLCVSLYGCGAPAEETASDTPSVDTETDVGAVAEDVYDEEEALGTVFAEDIPAADLIPNEAYTEVMPLVLGEWVALDRYPAAANDLVLREDGTGNYGENAFTWIVDWVEEEYINVKCYDDTGVLTYHLNFIKIGEDGGWCCSVSLVENYVDEGNWTVVHEDEEEMGRRYNMDTLEFVEITAENFEEYFEIRTGDSWSPRASGEAEFTGRWYYVLLRPAYAERLAYTESAIKFKYNGKLVYYRCELDFENMQCTLGDPFPEIESEGVFKTASFDLNNDFDFIFPGEYCMEMLVGGNGMRPKETGDIYYTAVLEDFVIQECSGQLILAKEN